MTGLPNMPMSHRCARTWWNMCDRRIAIRVVGIATLLSPVIVSAASVATNIPQGSIMLVIGPEATPLAPGPISVAFPVTAANVGTGPLASTDLVQIEMGVRRPGGPTNVSAQLRAQVPVNMTGPGTISMNTISWTSVLPAGASYTDLIAPGTFSPGAGAGLSGQLIAQITTTSGNTQWVGGTLTFSFSNSQSYGAGNYAATVRYTAWYLP